MTLTLNIDDPDIPEFISPDGNREALKELGRMIVRRFFDEEERINGFGGSVSVWNGERIHRRTLAAGSTAQTQN